MGVSGPEGMPEGSSCDTYLYPMIREGFERNPCTRKCHLESWGLGEAWPSCHPCPLTFLPLQRYQEGRAAAPLSADRSSSSCELRRDTTEVESIREYRTMVLDQIIFSAANNEMPSR